MSGLHIKYRPKDFSEIIGNSATVRSIQTVLSREDKPHVFLLSGQSGTGKTTLARIIAKELNCSDNDFTEINSANNRGIDTAREIINNMKYKPLNGTTKVYLLDECFAKNTKIKTINGEKEIKNIKIGDYIYNINGKSKVENIYKNLIPLHKIIKLNLTNNTNIICTKEHLFLTNKGWKKAINLTKKDLILEFDYSILKEIKEQRIFKNDNKNLRILWRDISSKKKKNKVLFSNLYQQIKKKIISSSLRILWKTYVSKKTREIYKKILQSFLCRKIYCKITSCYRNTKIFGESRKTQISNKEIQERKSRKVQRNMSDEIKKNERKKSNATTKKYRKNEKYQKNKWFLAYFQWGERWEWKDNNTTKNISLLFRLGNGIFNFFNKKTKRISYKLQSRYRKQGIKNWNRGGWERAFIEKKYIKRYKKRKEVKRIRVENIEIYKSGYNDKSFSGIIKNKERNSGYVIFYDLQIEGHPSYFANNILVHNCHKTTPVFQEAMLKPFEDTPSHVYFIIATTEPDKILKTVRNRCTQFATFRLKQNRIIRLLEQVAKKENIEISDEIYNEIAIESEGTPRNALIMLDKVRDLENEDDMLEVIRESKIEEKQVKELCQILLNSNDWKKISGVLKGIEAEPENVRRAVLGYMGSVLLNSRNSKAAVIIECFEDNFYNSGKAGLIKACFEVVS